MGTCVPPASAVVLFALGTVPLWSFAVLAADTAASGESRGSSLEEIVVTGSLIPQAQVQLATPVSVITEQDIQAKGFADVAEALQRSAFATGGVENGQFAGFTQAAKVVSFFGLDASFTKFLLDGRPIADYPALYNGSENFVSITGIPTVLVDHVDTLPGAQSTIYGSDAIAGVVNVVMKKNFDGPIVDVRYGWTADGGGDDRRIAIGDGFTAGAFNVIVGGQYDKLTPIWGYQRPQTSQYYTQGSSPQTAERDYLVYDLSDNYYLYDPANCANLSGLFNGSVGKYSRPDHGDYCGTVKSGFLTIQNGDEQTQGYLHATYDINDHAQVFVETLLNHDVSRFNAGPLEYDSSFDSTSPYYYFEDPVNNPGTYLNIRHVFAPEESGGLTNNMNKNTNNTVRGTLGVGGALWAPAWRYLADFTYTVNKLTESTPVLLAPQLESYFGSTVFGPNIGYDSMLGANEYMPNYANLYKPVSVATYRSFSSNLLSYSQTEESFARAQITSTDLFTLPGGNAGLALQAEAGDQGWFYNPDPDYFNGVAFGYTATAGSGHRSRYAGTSELQLPVLSVLTLNMSGRYDDYRLEG
jgi:outer membrane receptor protein involved in Fe transport